MQTQLFPSFSFLLLKLISGEFSLAIFKEKNLFIFGCTKEGISETLKRYGRGLSYKMRKRIMSKLGRLERKGRVFWRVAGESSHDRFKAICGAVGVVYSDVLLWAHHDASWNIPALKDFVALEAPHIHFMWR